MINLHAIFDEIKQPLHGEDSFRFASISIPEYPHFRLAKDALGSPTLLISVSDSLTHKKAAPIALEHLNISFDVPCRITKNNNRTEEGIYTVIRCIGQDQLLHTYFLRTLQLLIDLLPHFPKKSEVSQALSILIELFRAISTSPRKSLQGLWAELLVIDNAARPEILVEAWHATPYDRFDFNLDSERLEVKSTSQRTRQHHFLLDQLTPIEGTHVVIASLFTERVNSGVTIMDIADNIRKKISKYSSLVGHFDRIMAITLGNNWRAAYEEAFDKQIAISTLEFYDAKRIPTILLPLPVEVTEVHFRVDLSGCIPVKSFPSSSVLFAATKKR